MNKEFSTVDVLHHQAQPIRRLKGILQMLKQKHETQFNPNAPPNAYYKVMKRQEHFIWEFNDNYTCTNYIIKFYSFPFTASIFINSGYFYSASSRPLLLKRRSRHSTDTV